MDFLNNFNFNNINLNSSNLDFLNNVDDFVNLHNDLYNINKISSSLSIIDEVDIYINDFKKNIKNLNIPFIILNDLSDDDFSKLNFDFNNVIYVYIFFNSSSLIKKNIYNILKDLNYNIYDLDINFLIITFYNKNYKIHNLFNNNSSILL